MNNDLDKFSLGVKQALEGIDPSFDSNAWDRFEHRLNEVEAEANTSSGKKGNGFNSGLISGIGVAASIFVASFISQQQNDAHLQATHQPHQVETIAEVSEMKQTIETQAAETAVVTVVDLEDDVLKLESHSTGEIANTVQLDEVKPVSSTTNTQITPSNNSESTPPKGDEVKGLTSAPISETKEEVINLTLSNQVVCVGQNPNLELSSAKKGIWLIDGVESSKESFQNMTPGVHEVSYRAGDIESNTVNLVVAENPIANFDYQLDKDKWGRPVIQFTSASLLENSNKWNLATHSIYKSEFSQVYETRGDYPIQLITTNEFGCSDTVSKMVSIDKDYNLLAPTAFSPNGDGINDTWLPQALHNGDANFRVMIYNKAGVLVFESSDPNREWDGKVNGRIAQVGEVFVWKATAELDQKRNEYGGIITIYNH